MGHGGHITKNPPVTVISKTTRTVDRTFQKYEPDTTKTFGNGRNDRNGSAALPVRPSRTKSPVRRQQARVPKQDVVRDLWCDGPTGGYVPRSRPALTHTHTHTIRSITCWNDGRGKFGFFSTPAHRFCYVLWTGLCIIYWV